MTTPYNTLIVQKINNVHMKLYGEPWMLREIQEHFSYFMPNYKHSPKFKAKQWDGKLRLLNLNTKCMYLGLYEALEEFCVARGYTVALEDVSVPNRRSEACIGKSTAGKIMHHLNLPSKFTIRDYQEKAVADSLIKKRNLVISATGSGKSLIMYSILRPLVAINKTVLIIVPRIGLVKQLLGDFEEYSVDNKWDVGKNTHVIYEGQSKIFGNKKVVISTWQSLYRLEAEWFSQFDAILCDEVHEYTAECTKGILEKCDAEYRLGFTGTLDDTKLHEYVLQGIFAKPVIYSTSSELMDRGELTRVRIRAKILHYTKEMVPKKIGSYQEEVEYIIDSKAREDYILKLALSCKGNTVVMFNLVDKHANVFYEKLCKVAANHNKVAILMTGKVDPDTRDMYRKSLAGMDNAIVVASFGSFSTGSNAPNLHNMILGSPTKSKIRVLQSIGRILRLFGGKDKATVYDIVDDMTIGKRENNSTLEQFIKRYEYYIDQNFDVDMEDVQLR